MKHNKSEKILVAMFFIFALSGMMLPAKVKSELFSYQNSEQIYLPEGHDIVGELKTLMAKHEDTLLDLARSHGLGFIDIIAANQGVDPWVPGEGTKILLPTAHIIPQNPRLGLIINLAEQRLYLHKPGSQNTITFPIGVGRDGWNTPLGNTKIIRKKENPIWFPPKSIREENPDLPIAILPGPNNPLGSHALYFDLPGYLIHGTNRPWGVGRRVSHGCIRMYPEDIKKLYALIPIDTQVTIINQPIKVAILGKQIYMEAHPDPEQADILEAEGKIIPLKAPLADIFFRIKENAGKLSGHINWGKVRETLAKRTGIPTRITD